MIAAAPSPTIAADDLDLLARRFAALTERDSDRTIAAYVALAVREHRIDDAVRWQRVRLRARHLRADYLRAADPPDRVAS